MSFGEYKKLPVTELKKIFKIDILKNQNLFNGFTLSNNDYSDLQLKVKKMLSRINLSQSDNEATRSNLLVSHILWTASDTYRLGLFFEPQVDISTEEIDQFPFTLNGKYDCGLSLDEIDFIAPIITVVEVKKSNLAEGLGQCVAEMYATLQKFEQSKVYGIITDGEVWEFLLLKDNLLSINSDNYYIGHVADIVDRIGYIAEQFTHTKT